MALEPINIFSHRIDPRGVAELLRKMHPDMSITGPEDDWSEIEVVTSKGGLFKKKRVFALGHDSEYYDGEDWSQQVMGMQGYFSRFPETPQQKDIFRLIRSFRFSLSVPVEDLDIEGNDARVDILFAVCRHLDAAIFTPSSLRDASGRILYDASGFTDPAAKMPAFPPTEDHPDAEADEDLDEDYEDPEPPTAARVATRVLAMTALCARATLELDCLQKQIEADEGEKHRERLLKWISEIGVSDELEPQEWKVIQRPVGSLEQQDFINAMWRVEGLVVLAWALQIFDVPPYDELVAPVELYTAVGIFDADAGKQLLENAKLRSDDELQSMLEHLLAFHWRIRDFSLRPESMDFVAFSKDCWFGSFDISKFRVINDDMAIGEVAIVDADPDELGRVTSTAMERHQAINWLTGYASSIYSEVTTDT